MSEVIDRLKIAIFPKRCEFCGEVIEFDKTVCKECEKLENLKPPLCLKCGHEKEFCSCKKYKNKREINYKAIISAYYYENSVVKGILNFKYGEMPKLANRFGTDMADIVTEYYSLVDFDFVTFVPMLKRDENERGYNQAELLASVISKKCNIKLQTALYKKRKTAPQKRQTGNKRYVNLYGAFDTVKDVDVKDKIILLVDDVKTTGSTINSSAEALKIRGAKEVYAVVLATVK